MLYMNKRLAFLLAGLLLYGAAGRAHADFIYDVRVDTSSINAVAGALEVQFNPNAAGNVMQAVISNFSSNGSLGSSSYTGNPTGDVSGNSFGTGLTIKDDTGFNDFFQDFTYGNSFSFKLTVSGNPNPGAEFALTLWDTNGATGNQLLSSSDPSGAALALTFNPSGTSRTASSYVTYNEEFPGGATAPGPASLTLVGIGAAIAVGAACRRRKGSASPSTAAAQA